jgi:hypothetical protein
MEPTRIALVGASLGGLEGAFLSVIDADKHKIGIDTYLLVNPPLDLNYALKKVDEWNALSAKFGRDRSKRLVGRSLAIVDADHWRRSWIGCAVTGASTSCTTQMIL